MSRRLGLLTLLAVSAVALIAFYYFVDPARSVFVPKCVFHELTGLNCPGCGAQRMAHALFNGDFREAWHQNAFIIIAFPVLLVMLFAEIFRERLPRLHAAMNGRWAIRISIFALCFWSVYHNLQ